MFFQHVGIGGHLQNVCRIALAGALDAAGRGVFGSFGVVLGIIGIKGGATAGRPWAVCLSLCAVGETVLLGGISAVIAYGVGSFFK